MFEEKCNKSLVVTIMFFYASEMVFTIPIHPTILHCPFVDIILMNSFILMRPPAAAVGGGGGGGGGESYSTILIN